MPISLASPRRRPSLWTSGDWNATFGFGMNILVNLLTLIGLMRGVIGMPDAILFGRILPAAATMMLCSTGYYAWLAYRLAQRTGRDDVCALPSGISVPPMFIVVLVVMLPVKLATGDPILAWQAGLAWVFVQSLVLIGGAFVAPWVRRVTPRPALLGALAGVSLTYITMGPLLRAFETPMIGLPGLAIVLAGWFGGARFGGAPAGLVLVIVGTTLAWTSNVFGAHWGGLDPSAVHAALGNFSLHLPHPQLAMLAGGLRWHVLGAVVATAIPFGLYVLIEAMDNVVSASTAGDEYPTTRVLVADGVVSLIGCTLGCPFVNAVYIGHPGWKGMGGRIGYSAATGLVVFLASALGALPLALALIPTVAVAPILVYVGLLIAAQAFAGTPRQQLPAVVIAMLPALASWTKGLIDNALAANGVGVVSAEAIATMARNGVFYHGLALLGGGSILSGILLGAITVSAIDRAFRVAAAFCAVAAGMTFFGLMHSSAVGWASSPTLATSYIVAAVIFVGNSLGPSRQPLVDLTDE